MQHAAEDQEGALCALGMLGMSCRMLRAPSLNTGTGGRYVPTLHVLARASSATLPTANHSQLGGTAAPLPTQPAHSHHPSSSRPARRLPMCWAPRTSSTAGGRPRPAQTRRAAPPSLRRSSPSMLRPLRPLPPPPPPPWLSRERRTAVAQRAECHVLVSEAAGRQGRSAAPHLSALPVCILSLLSLLHFRAFPLSAPLQSAFPC